MENIKTINDIRNSGVIFNPASDELSSRVVSYDQRKLDEAIKQIEMATILSV